MRRPPGEEGACGSCWLSRDRTEYRKMGTRGHGVLSMGSCHTLISRRAEEWQGLEQGAGDQTKSPGQWPRQPGTMAAWCGLRPKSDRPGLRPISVTRRLVDLG